MNKNHVVYFLIKFSPVTNNFILDVRFPHKKFKHLFGQWSLCTMNNEHAKQVKHFGLLCASRAGICGNSIGGGLLSPATADPQAVAGGCYFSFWGRLLTLITDLNLQYPFFYFQLLKSPKGSTNALPRTISLVFL